MSGSDSSFSDEDIELQEAFASGKLKPGLNVVEAAPKQYVNNVKGLRQKMNEMKLQLPWIETLDSINKQAALAPEMAVKLLAEEQKRENLLKNNKKLQQFNAEDDPVLNDFKREMLFHRQAQATVLESLAKLAAMNISTIRPDDYFAEMAKTDQHMQKIRQNLMQKQEQQQRSERVKQLRNQRKEGKAIQVQNKLQRQKEKKEMLDQVKKVRKGTSKDLGFLEGRKISRKTIEKRKMKEKKFGFGGKKSGSKLNTKDSAADIADYKRPGGKGARASKFGSKGRSKQPNKRPGKSRRAQGKSKGRK